MQNYILKWDIPKEDSTSMNALSQRQAEDRSRGYQRGSTSAWIKATGCSRSAGKAAVLCGKD